MLNTSKAALMAAMLSLSAAPIVVSSPALAQESEIPAFEMGISVPSVIAVDSNMDEAALRDVFSSNFLAHAEALASLNAASITFPELTLTIKATDGDEVVDSTITYHDLVLTNIKDGYAETLTVARTESTGVDGVTEYGPMHEDGLDIRRSLELAGIVVGDPTAAMKPLYNSFTMASGSHKGPLYACSFGAMTGAAAEARPAKVPFSEVMAAFGEFKNDMDEPPMAAIRTVASWGIDVFRAIRGGASTVGAIDCTAGPQNEVAVKVAGAEMGNFEPGVYPTIALRGLDIDAGKEGRGGLGEFVLKNIDFNPTLDALEAGLDQLSEAWFEANWRSLIPAMAGLSVSALDLDAPNPESPGERIQFKLDSFDLTLGDYLNGIPTQISTSAKGLDIPLPQDSRDPQMQMLLAIGLTRLNLGFDFAAGWDAAANDITVSTVALNALDLGGMAIGATIGNATEDLFATDPDVALMAGLSTTVKSVTLNLSDDGIGELLWPLAAAEQGVNDVEAFRTQMAGMAEGLALQLLGSTDGARKLGAALGDLATGRRGEVTITLTAKSPDGLPLAVFMQAQDNPAVLSGQFDVTSN